MKTVNAIRVGGAAPVTAGELSEARSATAEAPTAGVSAAGTGAPVIRLSAKSVRRKQRKRWLELVTQPRVCVAVLGLSVLLLGYAVYVGSKMIQKPTRAAREAASAVLLEAPVASAAQMEALRRDATLARSRLVADRGEFKAQLARIEAEARKRGWHVELTLLPAAPAPGGVADVIAYSSVMILTPVRPESPPGVRALTEWLDAIAELPKHAVVSGLVLAGNGSGPGLATVRAEVRVLGRNQNEETSKD